MPNAATRTRAEWVTYIRAAHLTTVEAILKRGRALTDAKAQLEHGEFLAMIKTDLPFTASTAQRLMKIASDPRLQILHNAQLLPAAWGTAYELTKLSDEAIEQAKSEGAITPQTTRAEVRTMRTAQEIQDRARAMHPPSGFTSRIIEQPPRQILVECSTIEQPTRQIDVQVEYPPPRQITVPVYFREARNLYDQGRADIRQRRIIADQGVEAETATLIDIKIQLNRLAEKIEEQLCHANTELAEAARDVEESAKGLLRAIANRDEAGAADEAGDTGT